MAETLFLPADSLTHRVLPRSRRAALWSMGCAALLVLALAGCTQPLNTSYGAASGYSGTRSISGFAALHEMFEVAGWRTKRAHRLSPRLEQTQVIVWTPDTTAQPQHLHTWFDEWLGAEPDRTLIYVIKDGSLESHYWESLRSEADPDQRFEYRRRAARRRIADVNERLNRHEHAVEGWYELRPLAQPVLLDKLHGPWIDPDLGQSLPGDLQVEVVAYDADDDEGVPSAPPVTMKGPFFAPPDDQQRTDIHKRSGSKPLDFRPLISAGEKPLVVSLTDDSWNGSEAIVVVGPSLLTNYALTEPLAQRIAWRIVDRCGEPGQVAFITNGDEGLGVRRSSDYEEGPTGMELLTVWPINVVTMHAMALGIIVLLALFPIFGRPRRLPEASDTDFSRHVRALGELMAKGGDTEYARRQISEYFSVVRGEPESKWVLPPARRVEPPPQVTAEDAVQPPPSESSADAESQSTEPAEQPVPPGNAV